MSKAADSIIERWNEEIWNKGDMSAVDDLVAEDFVQYVVTSPSARGREALKQDVRSVRAAFAGRFTTEETIVDRTRIAQRWTFKGVHTGEWGGFVPTGRPIDFGGIAILHIVGGKIAAHWVASDLDSALQKNAGTPGPPLKEAAKEQRASDPRGDAA